MTWYDFQSWIWPALVFYALNIIWIIEPWWSRNKRPMPKDGEGCSGLGIPPVFWVGTLIFFAVALILVLKQ